MMLKKLLRRKFIKKVKRRVPWIGHLLDDAKVAGDLNPEYEGIELQARQGSPCLVCRGARQLCGKPRCPLIIKFHSFAGVRRLVDTEHMFGSSPPGIFVGRIGYPYVYAGPLTPPIVGDTSIMDAPEQWIGKTVDEIVDFRTKLIRGKFRVNVKKPDMAERFMQKTLELALSQTYVDAEITFKKKPSGRILLDHDLQPMGPSAVMRDIKIGNVKTDSRIEKAYDDQDLKSEEALLNLHANGVPVSKIQRAFSIGAFGLKKNRRIVPTRWSITAVDSTISRRLIEDEVKDTNPVDQYSVHDFSYLGNRFVVLMLPMHWCYEWIEGWYPGTAWNPAQRSIAMGGDWEGYKGRTTYASIGGCYYAVRLATAEFLASQRRQAGVIALREIHPGFITPLGVWINRECVREALKRESKEFNNLKEALDYVDSRFTIRIEEWIDNSHLLKDTLYQERLTKYLST
ncbi:MAG: Nre family DNA repair protein [Candidatus Bathyarchaeota archaeon]|nr:Nre family DNA repair protein [Candidatus Bathyarchaeota archaeon]